MLFKKKSTNIYEEDLMHLLEIMEKASEGDFSLVGAENFHNPEIAAKYNAVIERSFKANNEYVMRINDSMTRIGDSSIVKDMVEEIIDMRQHMERLKTADQELGDSISGIMGAAHVIQDNSHSINNISQECNADMKDSIALIDESATQITKVNEQIEVLKENAEKITSIIDMVKDLSDNSSLLALNASIEAARVGEAGKGFAVVAQQMGVLSSNTASCADTVVEYVEALLGGIESLTKEVNSTTEKLGKGTEHFRKTVKGIEEMSAQVAGVNVQIEQIYEEISTQSSLTKNFIDTVSDMGRSSENLQEHCMRTGKRFYQVSREVDKVRSDMARFSAKLSTLDWIRIYDIDHLIFTWRLYNTIAGFEQLKLEQVNNPKGCKVGKWFAKQSDVRITGSQAFKDAFKYHDNLHKYAVECWEANEAGNRETAMQAFYQALEMYGLYSKAIIKLIDVIKGTGDTEITEFKSFW